MAAHIALSDARGSGDDAAEAAVDGGASLDVPEPSATSPASASGASEGAADERASPAQRNGHCGDPGAVATSLAARGGPAESAPSAPVEVLPGSVEKEAPPKAAEADDERSAAVDAESQDATASPLPPVDTVQRPGASAPSLALVVPSLPAGIDDPAGPLEGFELAVQASTRMGGLTAALEASRAAQRASLGRLQRALDEVTEAAEEAAAAASPRTPAAVAAALSALQARSTADEAPSVTAASALVDDAMASIAAARHAADIAVQRYNDARRRLGRLTALGRPVDGRAALQLAMATPRFKDADAAARRNMRRAARPEAERRVDRQLGAALLAARSPAVHRRVRPSCAAAAASAGDDKEAEGRDDGGTRGQLLVAAPPSGAIALGEGAQRSGGAAVGGGESPASNAPVNAVRRATDTEGTASVPDARSCRVDRDDGGHGGNGSGDDDNAARASPARQRRRTLAHVGGAALRVRQPKPRRLSLVVRRARGPASLRVSPQQQLCVCMCACVCVAGVRGVGRARIDGVAAASLQCTQRHGTGAWRLR